MKKTIRGISFILCLLFVFSASSMFVGAESLIYEDFTYTLSDENTVTITGYNGTASEVVVPAEIEGYPVTAIGNAAFVSNDTMTSIDLPSSLTLIGINAFNSCVNLTAVDIPYSVEKVSSMAFYNCINLETITIGPSTYNIDSQAFHNTKWFNNAADGPLYIGRVLYSYIGYMPNDTTITVKYGTAAVAPYAFSGQSRLKSVYFPVGMRIIGSCAFLNCTGLLETRIPPSVTTMQSGAFLNANALSVIGVYDSAAHAYATDNSLYFTHDETLDYPDGDMNKDKKINTSDFRITLRRLLDENFPCDEERLASCDIIYDGEITTADVRMMMLNAIRAPM